MVWSTDRLRKEDQRQINVLPTALGRKRMMQIRKEVEDQDAQLHDLLGEGRTDQLVQLLRVIQ